MDHRKAELERSTRENTDKCQHKLDGIGDSQVSTGNGMLDHLIAQLSRHGLIDITLQAQGDLETGWHHLVEDTGICLGRAFRVAMGDGAGIHRMGHALVPLDETLAMVAVDLSGRGYAVVDCGLDGQMVETLPGELIHHFLESFALEAKLNLHVRVLAGKNGHHKAEAVFKPWPSPSGTPWSPTPEAAGASPAPGHHRRLEARAPSVVLANAGIHLRPLRRDDAQTTSPTPTSRCSHPEPAPMKYLPTPVSSRMRGPVFASP